MVVYPSSGGLRKETIRLTFEGNRYDGEDQIRATLLSVRKFSDDTSNLGTWISKIEERLFDSQNPVRWKDVKDRAASKPQWQLHLPRLVEIASADMCHQTNPRPCTAADFDALFKAAL